MPLGVLALLLLHWSLCLGAASRNGITFDEVPHLTRGYSYWARQDYRLSPSNGILPQRWAALPLWLDAQIQFNVDEVTWRNAMALEAGEQFLFGGENDLDRVLLLARSFAALWGVLICAVVFLFGRAVFGVGGGFAALAVAVVSPTLIAHASLATSDACVAFFYLASVGAAWWSWHRLTPWSLLALVGSLCGLVIAKFSWPLIVPILLILGLMRLARRHPLELAFGAWQRTLYRWPAKVAAMAAPLALAGAAAILTIWAAYGFRYSITPTPENYIPYQDFDADLAPAMKPFARRVLEASRKWELVPEGYIMAAGHHLAHNQRSRAFAMGRYSDRGWSWFFPYAFAIKTPLPLIGLVGLAVGGIIQQMRTRRRIADAHRTENANSGPSASESAAPAGHAPEVIHLWHLLPLLLLLGVWWGTLLGMKLNIGHRHMLSSYPPLFVLAGGAVLWFTTRRGRGNPRKRLWGRSATILMLAWLAWESLAVYPYPLAYFNQIVGGPAHGYRHLVDSNLDWGQGLEPLRDTLQAFHEAHPEVPVYVSMFGRQDPRRAGLDWTHVLPAASIVEIVQPLEPGLYAISATRLQSVYGEAPGPWNREYEAAYQEAMRLVARIAASGPSRFAALPRADRERAQQVLKQYEILRLRRLLAWLRHRKPDQQVAYAVLIYHLSAENLRDALHGLPTELHDRPWLEGR